MEVIGREEYTEIKNWKGTATRLLAFQEKENFKVGKKQNFGLSWTDGGEFTPETSGKYQYVVILEEETEGHEVDYDDETECEALGCQDCEKEKEILIDREFEIGKVIEYDEETGFGEVWVK